MSVNVVGADTFNRSDSTTAIGAASDGSHTWAVIGTAVYGINTNRAYQVSSSDGNAQCAYLDLGRADAVVSCDIIVASSGTTIASIVGRVVDANNMWRYSIRNDATDEGLTRRSGGSETPVWVETGYSPAAGATVNLKLAFFGSLIAVIRDGVLKTVIDDATHISATKFGIHRHEGATGTSYFDNFQANGVVGLVPTSDVSAGTWTDNAGGTSSLFGKVDESSVDDTDYIRSVLNPSSAAISLGLGSATDPAESGDHILALRAALDAAVAGGTMDLVTDLLQGASALSTPVTRTDHPSSSTWAALGTLLSSGQADAITDYTALRVKFTATQQTTPTPSFVAAGTEASTSTNNQSFSPGLPSGWAADDIHILVAMRKDNNTMSSLSGWTQWASLSGNVGSGLRVEVWWRRAVAGDAAPTVTFGTSNVLRGGRIYGFRGCVKSGDPLSTGSLLANTSASATVNTTDISPSDAPNIGLFAVAYASGANGMTTPTGWSTAAAVRIGTSSGGGLGHTTKQFSSAGSYGTPSTTMSGQSANAVSGGVLIGLKPVPNNNRAQVSKVVLLVPEASSGLSATKSVTSTAVATVSAVVNAARSVSSTGAVSKQVTMAASHAVTSSNAVAAIKNPVLPRLVTSANSVEEQRAASALRAATSTAAVSQATALSTTRTVTSIGAADRKAEVIRSMAVSADNAVDRNAVVTAIRTVTSTSVATLGDRLISIIRSAVNITDVEIELELLRVMDAVSVTTVAAMQTVVNTVKSVVSSNVIAKLLTVAVDRAVQVVSVTDTSADTTGHVQFNATAIAPTSVAIEKSIAATRGVDSTAQAAVEQALAIVRDAAASSVATRRAALSTTRASTVDGVASRVAQVLRTLGVTSTTSASAEAGQAALGELLATVTTVASKMTTVVANRDVVVAVAVAQNVVLAVTKHVLVSAVALVTPQKRLRFVIKSPTQAIPVTGVLHAVLVSSGRMTAVIVERARRLGAILTGES